ncbi:MAG TPA: hypothetical protein VL326_06460 [Kofleriaceae bacterium]|nr:hypothetical protein [Kofleriaceae bacterium]
MRAAVAIGLCAWVGCYSPSPPQHVPCVDDDHCPSSQKCIAGYCGGTSDSDGGGIDNDAASDALPLCQQWRPAHFDPCMIPMPSADLNLTVTYSGYTLDTDKPELKGKMGMTFPITTMVLTQQDGPDVLLVAAHNFILPVNATLNITGSRPALFAVWGDANIGGNIDLSAVLGTSGPGAGGTPCTGSTGVSGVTGPPGTGGGGGGFQGAGGRGGDAGGLGGAGVGVPTIIRGGCSGGLGGSGNSGATGPRGGGGGAVQISALSSIVVDGRIAAGGGGGGFGRANLGAGGGGGSGGFIGLDAPSIMINGTVVANGGGAGGGGSDVAAGSNGTDGRTSAAVAVGGPGAATSNIGACGGGGTGAAGSALPGIDGGSSSCGGGGGGGGAGYIVLWTSSTPTIGGAAVISPPVSTGP